MTWSLFIITVLLVACGLLAWRYLALRRDIRAMAEQIRRKEDPTESASELGDLDRKSTRLNSSHRT